jgi:TATA-binding protein-associated factor
LFILLESGSAPITRKAAAKQIGEVQKLHPHELHNLLNRLITYLHSSNWDTRIAASQAVQAILENVPQWTPPTECKDSAGTLSNPCNSDLTRLSFDKFDLDNVLRKGAHLMGSEGKEFDLAEEVEGSNVDERERLAKQRELLNEKLGLNQAKSLGE